MEEHTLSPELGDQDRLLLVFAYLGPLVLFTLVAARKEFVKWHAKQGILVSATTAVLYLIVRAVHVLVSKIPWHALADLVWIAGALVGTGVALAIFLCIVRALEGERFKVPLLGELADQF